MCLIPSHSKQEQFHRLVANDSSSLKQSSFDPKRWTVCITHGFLENADKAEWMHTMKERFLKMVRIKAINCPHIKIYFYEPVFVTIYQITNSWSSIKLNQRNVSRWVNYDYPKTKDNFKKSYNSLLFTLTCIVKVQILWNKIIPLLLKMEIRCNIFFSFTELQCDIGAVGHPGRCGAIRLRNCSKEHSIRREPARGTTSQHEG